MGRFLGFVQVHLLPRASFFVLSLVSLSSVQEVVESLRVSGSSRMFPSENQMSKDIFLGNKLNAEVQFGSTAKRKPFALRSPAYAFAADLPSAFLSVTSAVSRTEEGDVQTLPALTVVDLGFFEVINPLPENGAKSLDLSWLVQVVLAKKEAENLPNTQPSPLINGADESTSRDSTGGTLPPHQPQEYPNGHDKGRNEEMESERREGEGGREGSSLSSSLPDAIRATGDKSLIEEAGLDSKNPWEVLDNADALDVDRNGRMRKDQHRDQLPEGGTIEGVSQGGGSPGGKEEEASQGESNLPKQAGSGGNQPSGVFVGKAVKVDATYIFEGTAGHLGVQFSPGAPKLCRTVVVENTSSETLRVFARTTGANFTPSNAYTLPKSRWEPNPGGRSFLENSAYFLKHIFLQASSVVTGPPENSRPAKAKNPALTTIDELLEQFRRSGEDRPGKPSDLVIHLLQGGTESDGTSTDLLDLEKGAKAVAELRQLMEKVFGRQKKAVQVMKALQMIIVSFPYGDEFDVKVKEVLEFIRQSFDGFISRWSFAGEVAVTSGTYNEPPSTTNPADLGEGTPFVGALPNDPELQKKLYGMFMTNISSAWMHGEKGKGAVVAVLDTGVSSHDDLGCNFWNNPNERDDGSDSDGNGLPDDVRGYNFDEEIGEPEDYNGHGTHVAGIIGACANDFGVVGGSHEAKLMSLRFMDKDGSGAISNGIRAIAYAIAEGVHVLNNSWGGPDDDPVLQEALEFTKHAHGGKGMLIVNAAGNEAINNDRIPSYPTNWRNENTISVAAVDQEGHLTEFSNWGPQTVDIAAPGATVYSTAPGGQYQFLSGTSMATPHVSAIAALVYGAFLKSGYLPPASEVKDILRLTVKKLPTLKDRVAWEGIPDAKDAILMARMGGMWVQSACEDMIVRVPPGAARIIKVFFNGYRRGTFRAYFTLDVFNEQQSRVDQIQIPFTLESSPQPAPNKHSDADAIQAFSNIPNLTVPSEEEESIDLCRLQVKFLDLEAGLPLWAIILLGAIGTIVMLAVVVGCIVRQKRQQRRNMRRSNEEEAFLPHKKGKLLEDDDDTRSVETSRSPLPTERTEPEIIDVPRELYSAEDAYR